MERKSNSNVGVQSMQLLLKSLYIYYNYEELVDGKHNTNHFRDKEVYRNRISFDLEKNFKGRSEQEIKLTLFEVLLEDFRDYVEKP